MPSRPIRRRDFLKASTALGAGILATSCSRTPPKKEKLNIGVVGVTNRGGVDIAELAKIEQVEFVALCDVDDSLLGKAAQIFPQARTYNDYRKLLEQKDIDAVVVATADHMHAWITLAALRSGRHVYCEKPLAHSLEETRLVTEVAQQTNRVTQMGIQIHADQNYHQVVEVIRAGTIGKVGEVHVFVSNAWFQDKVAREGMPVPPQLHWDTWLGSAPPRSYSPDYLPAVWRRWWAFGEGTLGDMGCHYMDLPNWALELGPPARVRAEGPPVHPEWCPQWLQVEYEFPARGERPPVKLTWHDAARRPPILKELNLRHWPDGVLFLGEKGMLIADYTKYQLLPAEKFKDYQPPPPKMPASIGHHNEWVQACLNDQPHAPACNFSYSGPLTETVLLGTVAYRSGKQLQWDAQKLLAPNAPEAEPFIRLNYRNGWKL